MPSFRYTGDGNSYYEGVPMRDMSADEFDALEPQQQDAVSTGALYADESAPRPARRAGRNFQAIPADQAATLEEPAPEAPAEPAAEAAPTEAGGTD